MSTQVTPVTPVTPASGKSDAERIRTRTPRGRPRGSRASKPITPAVAPEEREFWGRQVQGFWNNLAVARGYAQIPDSQVGAIGEPAALTAAKYLKDAKDEHPEYLLLFVLTPYIMGAVRIEWERWTTSRAARDTDAGGERSRLRSEGKREEQPRPQPLATKPLPGSSGRSEP